MKRLFAAGVATTVAAIVVTGCAATPPSDPDGEPSITIWVDATREASAKAYAEAVADTVEVKVELKDNAAMVSDIALANKAGSGWPDLVFTGDPNSTAQFRDSTNGFAEPLDDLVSADVLEDFGDANLTCEFDGQTWCLKNDLAQSVLWFDETVFNELGLQPPTTFEEFGSVALTLKDAGYLSGAIGSTILYYGALVPSGCTFTDVNAEENSVVVDPTAEECTRVAETIQPLIEAGVFDTRSPFDPAFMTEVAQKGTVAMQIGASWFGAALFEPAENWAVPAGNFSAAEMPKWDGNDVAYSGQFGGGIWTVSSHSDYKQAAADAAVWLISDEAVVAEAPTYPAYLPAAELWSEGVADDPFYASNPIPAFEAQAARLQPAADAVLFDVQTAALADLTGTVQAGGTLQNGIDQFASSISQLAAEAGYTVE